MLHLTTNRSLRTPRKGTLRKRMMMSLLRISTVPFGHLLPLEALSSPRNSLHSRLHLRSVALPTSGTLRSYSKPIFTLQCGDKEIRLPFSTVAANQSFSPYFARCIQSEVQIQFEDGRSWYTVKEINYNLKTLTIIDQALGDILDPTNCNFLYVFSAPLQHFIPPNVSQFKNPTTCSWKDYNYLQSFIPEFYNLNPCKCYNIYRWNRLKNNLSEFSSALCNVETPHPPFDYKLSFSKDDKWLSLLSFGFSAHLILLQQCFNYKKMQGKLKDWSYYRSGHSQGRQLHLALLPLLSHLQIPEEKAVRRQVKEVFMQLFIHLHSINIHQNEYLAIMHFNCLLFLMNTDWLGVN